MKIKEVFKNEQEDLLKAINELPQYNCIDNFFDYLQKTPEKDQDNCYTLEGLFIKKLNEDINDFLKDIAKDFYKNKSKEEVIETLIATLEEGSPSMDYCLECGDGSYLIDDYCTEEEAYPLIKQFMLNTLNSIIKERNEKSKEKRIKILKNTINTLSSNIGISQQCLKEAQEELDNLLSE